eukprot:TRINITY_DN4117_c0_g1_i1.p1 TRINITY_DN4117_c0_g1~~TRINITY_DN4117_c0_g1_i1.p1  ORF type:complete len:155 (-),score=38.07 TRINITY_DN4117_c0_g1_i1:17-460(-)
MKNFNTLFGILSGLKIQPTFRLYKTLKKVSEKYKKRLAELEVLMSVDGNSANYRKYLSNADPPCMPYLGVHLGDLTHSEDVPDDIDNLINFKKRTNMVQVIETIQQYQQRGYEVTLVEPYYTFLKELPYLEMEQLQKISMALEPKKK